MPPRRAPGAGRHGAWLLAAAVLMVLAAGCAPDAPDGGIPTHPSDRFSVTLAWDAPATDAMGGALTDLAGYRLYHSPSQPANGPDGAMVEVGPEAQYTVENLEPGVYFFAVTAVDEAGNESELSEELRAEVGGP